MLKRFTALICALTFTAAPSFGQEDAPSGDLLAAQAASGGYIPVSLLEEGLRSCEALGEDQMDHCGAILLNALRTAFKFRIDPVAPTGTTITRTRNVDRQDFDRYISSNQSNLRNQIFNLEAELDLLLVENRLLREELSQTYGR